MFTSEHLRFKVIEQLGPEVDNFDVDTIVDKIERAYGATPIDDIPVVSFAAIVADSRWEDVP